jgi:hypothetical protein
MLLVMHKVVPDSWTTTLEEATASDVKNIERTKIEMERERLLENDAILRAIYQFPTEPIIRYSWIPGGKGKTQILYNEAQDILRATRFSIVKPTALIPDFLSEPQEKIIEPEESDTV